ILMTTPQIDPPSKTVPPASSAQIDRTLGLLWLMYIVSSAVFVGLGYWILRVRLSEGHALSSAGLATAGVLAILVSEGAIYVSRNAARAQDARTRLTLSLVALSLAEVVAIGGILAGWLLGSHYPLILLAAVSLVLFFRLSISLR
ncbi:MAG: hypothetical protein EBU49_05090, partial [Proteobacteria bacterium]|nr:hypothetical protein [Pseudomonadota bacterium]